MVAVDHAYLSRMEIKPRPAGTRPCLMCLGTGCVFPMRKDGQPDLRYARPSQPCQDCLGKGWAA